MTYGNGLKPDEEADRRLAAKSNAGPVLGRLKQLMLKHDDDEAKSFLNGAANARPRCAESEVDARTLTV